MIYLGPLDHPLSNSFFVPKTKLNIGKRAFSVAASIIWNQLPIAITSSDDVFEALHAVFLDHMYWSVQLVRYFSVISRCLHTNIYATCKYC